MVVSCVAYNCTNRYKKGCGISFYRFPKDSNLRRKWIIATKRENFEPSEYSRLCSKHFATDALQIRPNCNFELLKPDAIPTIFDFPQHLNAPPVKKRRSIVKTQLPVKYDVLGMQRDVEVNELQLREPSTSADTCSETRITEIAEEKTITASPTKARLRRQVKVLQQKLKRRDIKIKSMKEIIFILRKKLKAPENLLEILETNFTGFPLHLILNSLNNKGKSKFSEQMKEFALTLYFYSPKSYNYLRKQNLNLPHPSTLRKWISRFNCSPGFLQEVFEFLKCNVSEKDNLKHVSLVFDSMSIRKQIIYDEKNGKNLGYVDVGGLKIDGHEELASEALVFQVVSLRGSFKSVIGYFFINKLNAVVLSQLIKMAIMKLQEVGIKVHTITFDGASTNISAMKELGCKFPDKPYFRLIGLDYDIYVMLDAAHMLKLCRNALADKRIIESLDGTVDFKYIEKLNIIQKEQGLKFANKLSDRHIFFRNCKMNVKVAAQTISSSVANAIDYLCTKNHPQFIGSKPTVKFLRVMDQLFDYLNSRGPYGKHFKGPIKLSNKDYDDKMLYDASNYLSKLKIDGISILHHPRKTFAIGFLSDICSIQKLRNRLLAMEDFKYLLSYKLSQDYIELFFSCVRSASGHNNNPNVRQFQWAVRKLMFRNSVRPSTNSNCLQFDPNHQSSILSFSECSVVDEIVEDNTDSDLLEIADILDNYEESYYKDNILYYISGFLVQAIQKRLKCEECCELLLTRNDNLSSYTHFTDFVSRGRLLRASEDVIKIVKFMYSIVFRQTQFSKLNTKLIVAKTCMYFKDSAFKCHVGNNDFGENNHQLILIKLIGNLFLKIVCHHLAREKTNTANSTKLGFRQKYTKLILFSNV